MTFAAAYALIGGLLIVVAVAASYLRRLPMTETMIYLGAGIVLGPLGAGLLSLHALQRATVMHRLAEVAVIASLFCAGLKLRSPLRDRRWRVPVRLAFISMAVTVGLIALVGVLALGLPMGGAVLLGAVLAPTDPVLASEVQVADPTDRDRVRFSLTGEAGLNDGTAFPFVMLGLGLTGLHDLGAFGWKWLAVDVLWAVVGGLAIGALLGRGTALLVLWLRREHKEGVGRDEFIALGLIGVSYGLALLAHTYGFLAVFAAGVALRAVERQHSGEEAPRDVIAMEAVSKKDATNPEKASAHMAGAVLSFNEQIDRIMEVALVVVVGVALWAQDHRWSDGWLIAAVFLLIRPCAVLVGLVGADTRRNERRILAWLGIRGIGSLYYAMYAVERGLPAELANRIVSLTLLVIAISVVVHGITATPVMKWYSAQRSRPPS